MRCSPCSQRASPSSGTQIDDPGLVGAGMEGWPGSSEREREKVTRTFYKPMSPLPTEKTFPSVPGLGLHSV